MFYSTQSCVSYVHRRIPSAPLVDARFYATLPHSTPAEGGVAVLYYPNSAPEYRWHVAIIESLGEKGMVVSECGYKSGKCTKRFIPWNAPEIWSFFQPTMLA